MFADLNDEQRAVVDFDGGPLRVLAGAGTGKTTALSARVARLVHDGVPADRILLLTFTRRAARQLVDRAHARLSRSGIRSGRISGGTFHSVAHRTLRAHAEQFGLPSGYTVLDPGDAADVMDLVRDEVLAGDQHARRFPRKSTVLDLYSRSVNTGIRLPDVVAGTAPWAADMSDRIGEVCRAYVSRKRRLGLLDFDDLLLYWRQALHHPAVGPKLGGQFDHVLVDEYQDVNELQVDILKALRGTDRRMTVVGDDAQAIYAFRAADPRHILDFDVDFPDAATLPLSLNYRSTDPILAVANAVAVDAPSGFTARLRCAHPQPGPTSQILRCADEDHQSVAVCERVLEHLEQGVPLRSQSVLARAAHHTSRLEIELGQRGIPFVKYGGLRYLEAAHVKDLLAAFRLTDNPRDQLSWFRLLQLLPGVGPATANRAVVMLGLTDPGEDAEVMLRWPLAQDVLPAAARSAADGLVRAISAGAADAMRQAITPLIRQLYPDADSRLSDLDVLVDSASRLPRLSDVAAEHALEPPRSTGDLAGPPVIDEDWLVLSTIHSAKGLEWDVVHLIHAADGNIPSDMALSERTGLEEERRLFYVAITRPRRHLHVYVPLRYHHQPHGRNDAHSWAQPSRFLSEPVRVAMEDVTLVREEPAATLAVPALDAAAEVGRHLDALFE